MSFFGFLGKVLTGGLSIATHGLINIGGGGQPQTSAALPTIPGAGSFPGFGTGGRVGFGGMMPTFGPGRSGSRALTQGPMTGGLASCPSGYHLGKHKSLLHPFGGCHKNRHMRVTNPKALRRAIRRLYGAEKMYARLLKVTHPHKLAHGGRVHPKPPRRRK